MTTEKPALELEAPQAQPEGLPDPLLTKPAPPPWDPSPDQAAAFNKAMAWVTGEHVGDKRVFTLGGLGGTGKSYLTGRLALELAEQGFSVVFATPTGKAAQVLKKHLASQGAFSDVKTIHSTIYRPQEDKATGRILGWVRREALDADLIVIDEASMVARPELDALLNFNIPILAVGDHGQLSPVGEDTGLMHNPDVKLEKIHRQARGNPIIRLAHMVRNGAPDDTLKDFIEDIADERLTWTRSWDQAVECGKPPGVVLTFTNKMRRSLNIKVREDILNLDQYDDPIPGETVICLKNKRLDDLGVLIPNGARGVIQSVETVSANHVVGSVEFDEPVGVIPKLFMSRHQFLRDKTFQGFDEVPGEHRNWFSVGALMDYGYAATVHKFQGSSSPSVAVFVERALAVLSEEERRRWLYTAASRASEKLMLVF